MPNVVADSQTAQDGSQNWNTVAAEAWYAGSWTTGSAYTLTQFDLKFDVAGSPTGTVTIEIWSSSAGDPGSLITNGTSNGIDATTIITAAFQAFTFATNPSLSNATSYFVVMKSTQAPSGTNYFSTYKDSTNTGTDGVRRDDNMVTPFNVSADQAIVFKAYKESSVTGFGGKGFP